MKALLIIVAVSIALVATAEIIKESKRDDIRFTFETICFNGVVRWKDGTKAVSDRGTYMSCKETSL